MSRQTDNICKKQIRGTFLYMVDLVDFEKFIFSFRFQINIITSRSMIKV